MNAATTTTYATDQAVIVRIPGGRTRPGVYVSTTEEGRITVRYENAKGEKTADFKPADVTPAEIEEQPAPADEVPVTDLREDEPEAEPCRECGETREECGCDRCLTCDKTLEGECECEPAEAEEPAAEEPAEDEPAEEQGPHTKEECEDLDGCTAEHLPSEPVTDDAPAPRRKKAPLPEGWVTAMGLTKVINERGLYPGTSSLGEFGIYKKISAAPADDPFPGRFDYEGYKVIVRLEDGIEWYKRWVARQAQRHANAEARREAQGAGLTDEEKAARSQARSAARALRDAEARLARAREAAEKAAQRVRDAEAAVETARKAAEAAAPAAEDEAPAEDTAEG